MTDTATITDPLSTAFAVAAGEGETFWWESQLFTIKCSGGGLGVVDCTLERGSEPPMHIHTRETEFIYVIDGELTVYVGDDTLRFSPVASYSCPGTFRTPSRLTTRERPARSSCTRRTDSSACSQAIARPTTYRASRVPRRRATTSPSWGRRSRTPV
jgi:hypothetical protein